RGADTVVPAAVGPDLAGVLVVAPARAVSGIQRLSSGAAVQVGAPDAGCASVGRAVGDSVVVRRGAVRIFWDPACSEKPVSFGNIGRQADRRGASNDAIGLDAVHG